jgi:hypothetical protein
MDPVEQAKKLREEYERALDAAENRRAAYHEAVLELHRSGKPLREIATELGLSHQRVHQIVSGESPRKRSLGRVAGGLGGLLILIAAISAFFWIRSYQPIAFAPAQVLSAGSVNTIGEGGHGALVGYSTGIGGSHRPYFGVTLQNTGRFTVHLLGIGRYAPLLPVLRGWSTRLLMAQGQFVQRSIHVPSAKVVRDGKTLPENGHVLHQRIWKPGRLRPFQPFDLAPGQAVMMVLRGVWHMDCHPVTLGAVTPPVSFPVQYSFLGKTTTAQLPLPSGLTIDPPNNHPYTDCHGHRGQPAPTHTQKHST